MSERVRVAITGIGLVSPIGASLEAVGDALRQDRHGIVREPSFETLTGLGTRLAAPIDTHDVDLDFPRKQARFLGRLGRLALFASQRAIAQANLAEDVLTGGRTGISYGSTHGSSSELIAFCEPLIAEHSIERLSPRAFLKFMSHTAPATLASLLGIRGRVITTCSACTSSSQGLGYGYEAIRHGQQDVMICGGAEELHPVPAAVFDLLMATSTTFNDAPDRSPRPFDTARDGLVIGEGAATFVLERWDHAVDRGAPILAEVIGYGTNCDGGHLTAPAADGMTAAMRLALADAALAPADIDYINAHATATDLGDIAESQATAEVFGTRVAVSSTKAFTGHTLGACGALEAAFCVAMMRQGFVAPSRNLESLDPRCAELDYVIGAPRAARPHTVMTNNFAFGGINTSLVLRAVD